MLCLLQVLQVLGRPRLGGRLQENDVSGSSGESTAHAQAVRAHVWHEQTHHVCWIMSRKV